MNLKLDAFPANGQNISFYDIKPKNQNNQQNQQNQNNQPPANQNQPAQQNQNYQNNNNNGGY